MGKREESACGVAWAKLRKTRTKKGGKQEMKEPSRKSFIKNNLVPILQFIRPKFKNECWNLHCEATFPECHSCDLIEKCSNWRKNRQ